MTTVTFGQRAPRLIAPPPFNLNDPVWLERDRKVSYLERQLNQLCSYQDNIFALFMLIDHSRELDRPFDTDEAWRTPRPFEQWIKAAVAQSLLQTFEFNEHLAACNIALKAALLTDVQPVKPSPSMLFKSHFPTMSFLRNSSAHPHEKFKSKELQQKHSVAHGISPITNDYKGGSLSVDVILEDEYICTWGGAELRYHLNQTTLDKLEEVKLAVFARIPDKFIQQA
tara:strand:- start:716 stop:1393 length:678 start_codon:yes stop_codon:yes gene_type:complete